MNVAASMRKVGARVIQSDYYEDPEKPGTSPREIDVRAWWTKTLSDSHALANVSLCIECKQSREKPWIAFTSEKVGLAGPARVIQRAATELGMRFLWKVRKLEEAQQLPLFQMPDRVAYGLTQAFTTGTDVTYQAVMSAAKAARASTPTTPEIHNLMEVAFPVVVVDGHLFECYLNEDAEIKIEECEEVVLASRQGVIDVHSIVNVVTMSALSAFAQRAAVTAEGLLRARWRTSSGSWIRQIEQFDEDPCF